MIHVMTIWVDNGHMYISDAELYLVSDEVDYLDICHEQRTIPVELETLATAATVMGLGRQTPSSLDYLITRKKGV